MIASYRDKRTDEFAAGQKVFSGIKRHARLKIGRLEAAAAIGDLGALPGNRFGSKHLKEELDALEMSAAELARQLGVPTTASPPILNGRRGITGDTALCLSHFFGTGAEFWLNLQSLYELRLAKNKAGKAIDRLPTS